MTKEDALENIANGLLFLSGFSVGYATMFPILEKSLWLVAGVISMIAATFFKWTVYKNARSP